jgi:CHAD domain-containing protein
MSLSRAGPLYLVGRAHVVGLQEADGGHITAEAVAAALIDEFSVGFGPPSAVRCAELDTFDRRLGTVGYSLRHVSDSVDQRLVLIAPGADASLTMPITEVRWPALVTELPAGAIREAVAPLATIRALMVIGEQVRLIREGEVRNQDQKIVARLELVEQGPDAMGAPARLDVHELRGYGGEARGVVRLLAAAGFRPVRPAPDDAKRGDTEVPHAAIDRSAPAIALLVSEWSAYLAAMRANLPGVLDDIDTEFLHDFRVAVRRTRSTLKLGRPALPKEVTDRWEPALKWLSGLTTPVRDLDVHQLNLPMMGGWLVAADPADLQSFAVQLRRHRSAARRSLVRGLRSARFRSVLSGWEDVLADLSRSPGEQATHLTAGELAVRSIRRAYRRVARDGAAITPDSPAEALHSLRARCKELRYALELFAPVSDDAARKLTVADLKNLQDILGRFQDADVQKQTLYGFAEEMRAAHAPTKALMAMGELVAHLDADQQRAREGFERAFARLTRPAGRQRMSLLTADR